MDILALKPWYAAAVIKDLKHDEIRGRPTKKRGTIGIYSTKKIPSMNDLSSCFSTLGRWEHYKTLPKENKMNVDLISRKQFYTEKNTGAIIGTAEISDCVQIGSISHTEKSRLYMRSYAPMEMLKEESYIWVMENPVEFEQPIKIEKWPSTGPWAKIQINGV